MIKGEWRRHAGSWAASLALHGVLGGVIVGYVVSSEPASVALPPHWNVALVELPTLPATPVATKKILVAPPRVVPQVAFAAMPLVDTSVPTRLANTLQESMAAPAVAESSTPEQLLSVVPVMANTSVPTDTSPAELANLLWQRMEGLKRYPGLARRNGWEGTVLIKVVLDGAGRLVKADIQQSSGYATLDEDAMRVLRAATPLKNEMIFTGQQQAAFMLPVPYRLQQ